MIIGDYPTKSEYNEGTSFSGAIGNALRALFFPYQKQIEFEKVFKTHYIKVPIVGYNTKNKKAQQEILDNIFKVANWDKIISEQIEAVNPNVIIAMGELACKYITNESKVHSKRGSIYYTREEISSRPRNVLVTLSIRDIYEENDIPFSYVQWDIGKAIDILNLRTPFTTSTLIWIPKTASELDNWWERAKHADFLTVDIETHHGYITCIGLSHDGYEAISIPLLVGHYTDSVTKGYFYKKLKEILSSGIPLVNQNIKYDMKILEQWGFPLKNVVGDTMLMAHTIYSELPKNLGFLSSIYTKEPYYKDEGREYNPKLHSPDRLLIYNAKDALVTHQIWTKQQEDAHQLGVRKFFYSNVMPLFFIYKQIEERGILVDTKKRLELYNKYKELYSEQCAYINALAGKKINPLSPTQTARFLYEILKCPSKTHTTPSGNVVYSTDTLVMKELILTVDKPRADMISRVLAARKIAKIIQYLEIPLSTDGRMRASIKLHGTETGRTSGGKSLEQFYTIEHMKSGSRIVPVEVGMTFQNIPKHGFEFNNLIIGRDLRTMFVPSPGYVFVEGDQSQAEARVVCVLAEDYDTLALFDATDVHKLTASWLYGVPVDAVTKEQRQAGKKVRHAGNYNISSRELAHQTQLDPKECETLLNKFHATVPKVRGIFHTQIRQQINKNRHLISPHGRRREFFGRITEDMYKEAYATLPQATVSDHNKFTVLTTLYEKYPPPLAYPLAESHDSLLFEVKQEIYKEFIDTFEEAIKTPINFSQCSLSRDYNLVIPGEIQLGEISLGELVVYRR